MPEKHNTIMIRKSEISLLKANLLSILLLAVVAGVLIPLFNWICPEKFMSNLDNTLFVKLLHGVLDIIPIATPTMGGVVGGIFGILYSVVVFAVLTIIPHELIHGLTAMVVGKAQWTDLKFGMLWKKCAAFCHCNKALTVAQYRYFLLMPNLILGIIPSVLSLILGNSLLLVYGMIGIVASIGDISMAWMLRKESATTKVYDHPSTAGYFLFDTDEELEEIKKELLN